MAYSITFYCPDSHLEYDLNSIEKIGAGGGLTARIRMAHALSSLGQAVTIYNHCPQEQNINGVQYVPADLARKIDTEVYIAGTSGDGLDLSSMNGIDLRADLKILMVHGVDPPNGIDLDKFDYVYALSNFVRDRIVTGWGIDANKVFTSYRGITDDYFSLMNSEVQTRDPYSIAYTSHPTKGLTAAIKIFTILRKREPRFSLHLYGGYRLWGGAEKEIEHIPNLIDHWLIGQRELASELQRISYVLHIQDREEPFGISLIEAMRAGCIVLASSVGAFPEIIQTGQNGFLIDGKSSDESTHTAVSRILLDLSKNEDRKNLIRKNAVHSPLSWRTIAAAWIEHWNWALKKTSGVEQPIQKTICPACGAEMLLLPDGSHCIACGRYQKKSVNL